MKSDNPEKGSSCSEVLVEVRDITRRFPGVVANDKISLTIRRGEIHTVLGENGAGKTTLINILAGMIPPDEGSMFVRGHKVTLESPRAALKHGISTVYQHFALVPTLSVIENIVLGTDSGFLPDLWQAERQIQHMLGDFKMSISPWLPVQHLSIGEQQRVEIMKALFRGSEVLLLDEPTSVLAPAEVEEFFQILIRLKTRGTAILFVTHKLTEALQISDRITVLRRGKKVGELGPDELSGDSIAISQRIVELMFGSRPSQLKTRPAGRRSTRTVLTLRNVTALGDRGTPAIQDICLTLQAGEIFGIAGVDGNGQKELAEVIAGQRPVISGQVIFDNTDITNMGTSAAAKAGISYLTDDRIGEGCISSLSVAENLVLKSIDRPPFSTRSVIDRAAIDAHARRLIRAFGIQTPDPWAPAVTLSGGNLQKLLLARELALDPKVLVCNQPTHGLDIKTARFIQQILRARADAGMAILLISAELDEVLELSDRIGVMYNGRLLDVFLRDEAEKETIGRLMLSG